MISYLSFVNPIGVRSTIGAMHEENLRVVVLFEWEGLY